MRKLFFILPFFFFGSHYCVAQKTIQKEFSSEAIHTLSIIDDAIFKIEIQSSEENTIKVELHISGENSENIIIEENINEGILSIKTGFVPFFNKENDKLAAHKVMALEMKVIIPKTISIVIKSNLASVETEGKIKNLAVVLENGSCYSNNFRGNAHIKTDGGNIKIYTQNNVSGSATSKFGIIENSLPKRGKFSIEAETNNGNISLLQTE